MERLRELLLPGDELDGVGEGNPLAAARVLLEPVVVEPLHLELEEVVHRGRALDRRDEARDVAVHAGCGVRGQTYTTKGIRVGSVRSVRCRDCEIVIACYECVSNFFVTGDDAHKTCAAAAEARSENAMRKRRGNGQRRKG